MTSGRAKAQTPPHLFRQLFRTTLAYIAALVLLPPHVLAFGASLAAASTTGFVLIEPTCELRYPIWGLFPLPATILQQFIGSVVLLATGIAAPLAWPLLRESIFDFLFVLHEMILASGIPHPSWPLRVGLASSSSLGPSSTSDTSVRSLRRQRQQPHHPIAGPSSKPYRPAGDHHPGLVNTGNTCFMNSAIQCLASITDFVQYLIRLQERAETLDVPTPVVDALTDILTTLNSPLSKRSAIRPTQLVSALSAASTSSSLRSLVSAHQQQDSHELLVLLLDAVSREHAAVLKETVVAEASSYQTGLAALLGRSLVSSPDHILQARRELLKPFEALVAQRTACLRCGYYDAIRHYAQEDLSLTVPSQRFRGERVTIEDCINQWAALEPVEWRCWHCTLNHNLTKVEGEIQRLENPTSDTSPAQLADGSVFLASSEMPNGSILQRHHQRNGSSDAGGASKGHTSKLSNSAKKRLKEARKVHSVLVSALSQRTPEEEFKILNPSVRLQPPPPRVGRNSSVTGTKQTVFSRPPQVLALHLNRSVYQGMGAGKNNTPIYFGSVLDLRKWCVDDGVEEDPVKGMNEGRLQGDQEKVAAEEASNGWTSVTANGNGHAKVNGSASSCASRPSLPSTHLPVLRPPVRYRLCSIVVHYGGHSYGHYVSYRRRPRPRRSLFTDDGHQMQQGEEGEGEEEDVDGLNWLRLSDETVTPVPLRDVLSQNVSLLFYQRFAPSSSSSSSSPSSLQRVSSASTAMQTQRQGQTNGQPHIQCLLAPRPAEAKVKRARLVERWQWDQLVRSRESTAEVDAPNRSLCGKEERQKKVSDHSNSLDDEGGGAGGMGRLQNSNDNDEEPVQVS